ncbi:MAG: hypothetical protein ACRD3Q_19600 [Terriglobales bacterium]
MSPLRDGAASYTNGWRDLDHAVSRPGALEFKAFADRTQLFAK